MSLLSYGLWADEARRMGKVIRQDFITGFLFVTGLVLVVRLAVFAVHGE